MLEPKALDPKECNRPLKVSQFFTSIPCLCEIGPMSSSFLLEGSEKGKVDDKRNINVAAFVLFEIVAFFL